MEQKTDRLYPSAPLEKDNLEQRSENKLNDVDSFNISNANIKKLSHTSKIKTTNQKRNIEFTKHLLQ